VNPEDLIEQYSQDSRTIEVSEALNSLSRARFSLKGLIGSSRAFVCASVFKKTLRCILPSFKQGVGGLLPE